MKNIVIILLIITTIILWFRPKAETEYLTIVEREVYLIHETEAARLTCYLWTGYPMANGQYPEEGWVASSDRSIPFGTDVIIGDKKYKVGDRTNLRFQSMDPQTIDIFWEGAREDCLKFGAKIGDVAIIK